MKARVTSAQTEVDPNNGNFHHQQVEMVAVVPGGGEDGKGLIPNGDKLVYTVQNEDAVLLVKPGDIVEIGIKA